MIFLVALAFIAPLIVLYFWFLNWIDRYEKEPFWLQCVAFLYGAIAATSLGGILTGQLSAATASEIFAAFHDPNEVDRWSTWLYAPIAEEATKGGGVVLFFIFGHLIFEEFDGPMDGVVYGGLIGLGFTATEDVLYISSAAAENGVGGFVLLAFVRTVLGGLGHACYTAMTGLGWGLAVRTNNPVLKILYPTVGFSTAVMLHGIHNWLPTYLQLPGAIASVMLTWVFFIVWFVMIAVVIGHERRLVLTQLADEVGRTLRDEKELRSLGTVFTQGFRNVGLFFRGLREYSRARRRQHLLIELAFVKDRLSRGAGDQRELLSEQWRIREQLAVNAQMLTRR